MDLDDLAMRIRPRGAWESIDLGFVLARGCAGRLWGAWLAVYVPIAILACIGLRDEPWLAALVVWWIEPLLDRVALHVLSRAVFGAAPPVRETLRAVPGLLRVGAVAALTWMRFDAARSLNLALWQLEGARGRAWRRRLALVERDVRGAAAWFTVACVHFEAIAAGSLLLLVYWMRPQGWDVDVPGGSFPLGVPAIDAWAPLVAWLVGLAIFEPLYVAGGFALYLGRRTRLEAWDVEIALRRMAARLARSAEREAA